MASYYVYPPGVYIAGPAFPSSPTSGTAVSANSFPSLPLSSSSTSSLPGLPEAPRPRTVPLPDVINDFRERYVGSHSSQVPPQPCVVDHGRLRLLNRPTVDPLLATPQHPTARPSLKWDLRHHPTTALLENSSISHADLSHCAIRSTGTGRAPVQSLILIFPLLPMEIEIRTSLSRTSRRAPGSVPCITVGDVLEGLYQGLRAPIEPRDFVRLSESEQRTLLRACEARCRCLPEDERSRHALRKVDYLARRRCFLGIWPAMPYEVPYGRRSREVYVVEVGTGDN